MAPRQRHISPDLMEALQVLKYSICKGSSSLSFTEGMSWEDEMANVRCRLLDSMAGSRPVCPFLLSFSLCPSFLLLSFPCLLIHLSSFLLLPSFSISPGRHIEHVGASILAVVDAGDALVTV